jgi:PfaD family protein
MNASPGQSQSTMSSMPPQWWLPGNTPLQAGLDAWREALWNVHQPLAVVQHQQELAVGQGGAVLLGLQPPAQAQAYPLRALSPALPPALLGRTSFTQHFGLKFPYIAGAMANGISSAEMVEAMAQAGMLGFFGAAGLAPALVEEAIVRLKRNLGTLPMGFNLIHSPNEPQLEMEIAQMYLRHEVRLISASAYLDVTAPLVLYRIKGLRQLPSGVIDCPNRVIGKVSRIEVARKFLSPAPQKILQRLLQQGLITEQEAALSQHIPVVDALTAEADSGGHTDNRPSLSLTPTLLALRDEMQEKFGYANPIWVGAAGGISTPSSAAAAFALGVDYILTGSVNQACVESGSSPMVREMLAQTQQADVTMAPAADMFEMGVKVQVLKRGTMFPLRARKLYDLYREYGHLQDLPQSIRASLERDYFRCSLEEAWEQTRQFFATVDPRQNVKAEKDPHHKMALVFRSYLGRSSKWANAGIADRKLDYQIWCGPAMGAFNEWTKGTFLEEVSERKVAVVAMNLLLGASVLTRLHGLRTQGIELPTALQTFRPLPMSQLNAYLS